MSSHELHQIDVVMDIEHLGQQRMDTLHRQSAHGRDVYSFEFDTDWLMRGDALALDPDLLPAPGRTYPPANRTQFGVFKGLRLAPGCCGSRDTGPECRVRRPR